MWERVAALSRFCPSAKARRGLRGRQLGFDGSHTGVARLSLGVVAVQGFTNSRRRLALTIGLCFDLRYEEEGRVLPLHFTSSCLDL